MERDALDQFSSVKEDEEEWSRPSSTDLTSDYETASIGTKRRRRRLDEGAEFQVLLRPTFLDSSRSLLHRNTEERVNESEDSGEDEMVLETGQLSFHGDEHIRFHGKMSGLHLLGVKGWKNNHLHEGGAWCVSVIQGELPED